MQLSTIVSLPTEIKTVNHSSRIFSIGSCFATNLASKLRYNGFEVSENPFGVLFHPLALGNFFKRAILNQEIQEDDVFYYNDKWHYFQAHSQCSEVDQKQLLLDLNLKLKESREFLKSATHVVITLGTAWVYKHLRTNQIVANCHKLPNFEFSKELLSVDEIQKELSDITSLLIQLNPGIQVIYTVSPVRHTKDSLVGNQRSKSHLIAGLHSFLENTNPESAIYFPSYEILMDELRDYRFYADDLLHPSTLAVDYIWEKFVNSCMDENTKKMSKMVAQVRRNLEHRSFDSNSEQTLKHQSKTKELISEIHKQFPHIQF